MRRLTKSALAERNWETIWMNDSAFWKKSRLTKSQNDIYCSLNSQKLSVFSFSLHRTSWLRHGIFFTTSFRPRKSTFLYFPILVVIDRYRGEPIPIQQILLGSTDTNTGTDTNTSGPKYRLRQQIPIAIPTPWPKLWPIPIVCYCILRYPAVWKGQAQWSRRKNDQDW